jgi:branched-chain amino acid transport system ATP-binding protein
MTALKVTGLAVRYGQLRAVDGVDLTLRIGARHALIGPNGAGKSTLVNLVTGALRADSGRVVLLGRDISALSFAGRVRAGLVRTFQVTSLFAEMTPVDQVTMAVLERERKTARLLRPLRHYGSAVDEAVEILTRLGLGKVPTRPVAELSYGQQRIVELALALAGKPRILVLDEPAAGIPAAESNRLFELLEELPEDVALLFVEHDMQLVRRFAQNVTVLVSGRVIAEGTPEYVAADPQVQHAYLGKRGAAA